MRLYPPLTKAQRADRKLLRKLTAEIDTDFTSIEAALAELQNHKRTASKLIKRSFDKLVGINFEATEERFRTVCLPCPVYALDQTNVCNDVGEVEDTSWSSYTRGAER
jgi:hypothetical protein